MDAWTPQSVLELVRGFQQSRIVLTAAELDLFTLLARESLAIEALAARLGADQRALTIVCDALTAMGLLAKTDGHYRCEPPVAELLAADSPRTVLPMVLHSAAMFANWARLTELVVGPEGAAATAIGSQADRQRAFIGAMHVVSGAKAHDMARHAPPGAATRLLDIGGASGSFTIAYLQASAALRATLFDLPPVVELARQRLADHGLLERVELVAGDFYTDDLPGGHDLALLSAIIHQNSRDQNVALYRKVLEALLPGGRLLIRDHVLAPDRTSPRPGALFAVNMLCATPGGNSYTLAEISEDLTSAGFERVKLVHPDTQMDGIVEAWRP